MLLMELGRNKIHTSLFIGSGGAKPGIRAPPDLLAHLAPYCRALFGIESINAFGVHDPDLTLSPRSGVDSRSALGLLLV